MIGKMRKREILSYFEKIEVGEFGLFHFLCKRKQINGYRQVSKFQVGYAKFQKFQS